MSESILRLRVESQEYDNKLKRAAEGLTRYAEQCRKAGGTLEYVEKETLDYVRAMGQMETTSKTASGKLSEMKRTFTEWGMVYKQMTDAEKASPVGKALSESLDQLKGRIQQTKRDMESLNQEMNGSKFGQFGSIIDGIGQKMGINANITELLTSKTALLSAGIGAAGAIVGKATQEWAKYNTELAKQDQITTVTTGLRGPSADRMTDQTRALVDTYNVDFREAINAANTLMTQFGESGEDAMTLIRDGMRGMIQGDGSKLLSMIQQYAPSFRDAGISASQLVAIIQNSEGGIFTDQNMNAIVMGIKNIRLMTNATSEALAKMGIDGQEMTRKLNDGTMTIFQAMQQVSNAINQSGSASQAAGEVMQQVFGRQGAAAGTKLGEAIATLNTNLEETKRQTGELGDAYDDLYNANVKLNGAIRDCFEYDGWEQMATGIKSKLVSALASVLDYLGKIKGALGGFSVKQYQGRAGNGGGTEIDKYIKELGDGKGTKAQETYTKRIGSYSSKITVLADKIRQKEADIKAVTSTRTANIFEPTTVGGAVSGMRRQIAEYKKQQEAIRKNMNEYDKRAQALFKSAKIDIDTKPAQQSIGDLRKKLKELNKERREAVKVGDQGRVDILTSKINQTKTNLGYLTGGGNGGDSVSGRTTPAQQAVKIIFDTNKASLAATKGVDTMPSIFSMLKDSGAAGINGAMGSISAELDAAINNQMTRVDELRAKWAEVKGEMRDGYMAQIIEAEDRLRNLQDSRTIGTITQQWDAKQDVSKQWHIGMNGDLTQNPDDKYKEKTDKQVDAMAKLTTAIGGVSSIMSGLEQMGMEIPDEAKMMLNTIQGLMSVVQGVQAVISIFSTTSENANTAATIANTVALGALTSAMSVNTASNFIPFFAHGGVVHAANGFVDGRTFSGDQIPAMLNAGELVLNKAQQSTLATQLQGSDKQSQSAQPYVTGEIIYLGLQNYLRANGYGQIVTTRNNK